MSAPLIIIERCPETGTYVGYVPGFPGAHSHGRTLEELNANMRGVIEMLLEDGEPAQHAREAILEHLNDLEDLYLAEQRLIDIRAGRSKTYSLEEVMEQYGLADELD